MNAIERARQLIELGETATKAPWKHVGYDSDLVGPYNRVCEFNTCDVYAKRDVSIEIEQDVVNAILISNYRNHAPEIAKLFLEAVEILESIGNDFYTKDGKTIKDFSRESLEEIIINDTNMAKSFVEMVKGKK